MVDLVVDFASLEKRHQMNYGFPTILPMYLNHCRLHQGNNYLSVAAPRIPPKQYALLTNPQTCSINVNIAIAVVQGGEVHHGWGNIKIDGEWARG